MAKLALIAVAVSIATAPAGVSAREEISGPVSAEILRVVDGDTLLVEARPWPQQRMEVYVRIRGIDAPELTSGCAAMREAAVDARSAVEFAASQSRRVKLIRISGDKYFGRIVADVILEDGSSLADDLLIAGLVRAYDGGRKAPDVCG